MTYNKISEFRHTHIYYTLRTTSARHAWFLNNFFFFIEIGWVRPHVSQSGRICGLSTVLNFFLIIQFWIFLMLKILNQEDPS